MRRIEISTKCGMLTATEDPDLSKDEIVIVPLRNLSHEDAKNEISNYVQLAGGGNLFPTGRKVYISEVAENLRLDIELVIDIMEELEVTI